MKTKCKIEKEIDIKYIEVDAGVRYWEDADVNDVIDESGDLIPCREDDRWKPLINIDTGIIANWEQGKTADIHYKVCDDGVYNLIDVDGNYIFEYEGYVPRVLAINDDGYGDYIIMTVDENGKIEDWECTAEYLSAWFNDYEE